MEHDFGYAASNLFGTRKRLTLHALDRAGFQRRSFYVYLLTPGFTRSYHQHVLGVSSGTLRRYLALAGEAAARDPTIMQAVRSNVASITAQDGLAMARRRGRGHLPHWARLAICEHYHEPMTLAEVSRLFGCSPTAARSAVRLVGRAFDPLSGERRLSSTQTAPPAQLRN